LQVREGYGALEVPVDDFYWEQNLFEKDPMGTGAKSTLRPDRQKVWGPGMGFANGVSLIKCKPKIRGNAKTRGKRKL